MIATTTKKIEVTLVLGEHEARWLMASLQNGPAEESHADAEQREAFFKQLKHALWEADEGETF